MESHKDGHHFPWLSRLPTSTRRPFNLVVFTRAFLLAQTTKFEMRKKIVHLPGRMLHVQTTKLDCRRVDVPPSRLSWEIMPAFVRFHRLFIEIERAHAGASMKYNKVQKSESEKLPSWRIASKSSKMIQRGNFLIIFSLV